MKEAINRPVKAIIHLDQLRENIRLIRQHLDSKQKFYAVVKADGYGHGAIPIARVAQQCGVDGLCVAVLDEALELRQAGIHLPILVLGITHPKFAQLMVDNHISVTVSSLDFLKQAKTYMIQGVLPIHVALDTGMNRIGLKTGEEITGLMHELEQSECYQLEGVFTHFATADGEDDNRVQKQYEQFQHLLSYLTIQPTYTHLGNSAMSIWRNHYFSDIVRIGIAMYGLNPSDFTLPMPLPIKPILSLETEIIHVHQLKRGEAVSYGAKYIAKEDEWIATLPLGYADGWRRDLGKQSVYIGHEKCDIVGVVCMDQMMIKISQPYPVGTKVELIGQHQSASDLAVNIGTIGYEILCGISQRVHRVYVDK
ncbi:MULTISPECIES: alanine racemase [unclassified Granulicatella]|uniref:alanine racemase n=1 Tax=unclassified Granulicatella TaxID=2630493 RepID=UPI001073E01F|nr:MULTISPECIES: alanine racemase [unclassified Granulicatella]MBF0780682.1 alanine racemase [Granulicatella sp. 19428wC4_WM01]TFU94224.1 alanine racemase [Granulicatella sp. WM01]